MRPIASQILGLPEPMVNLALSDHEYVPQLNTLEIEYSPHRIKLLQSSFYNKQKTALNEK